MAAGRYMYVYIHLFFLVLLMSMWKYSFMLEITNIVTVLGYGVTR